ncbi:BREX-6 system phosphatase PglZ [Sorangium sp. So ce1182]|uniref:BREX-6 system phosphatase PglZ n=1 Tax=Sorangium sp. So ce1182 TaxID=3133334 RepID=UPI003F6153FF
MTDPSDASTTGRGPVSAAIEQEVLGELRRQGIVVWLDKDGHYTRLVDDLAAKQARGEFPFPVVAFRGSFLELLFHLEPFGSGLDKQPLLIHMPGFNEDAIRKTPVLELYEPGVRFRKALDTLIREAASARLAPAEVEKFVAKQPTLEEADAWLTSAVSQSTFGLAAALDEFGPRMLAEALAQPGTLAPRVSAPEELATLRSYIHKLTGMDEAWETFYPGERDARPFDRLLDQLGGWVLAVEFVHDLRRPAHDEHLRRLRSLSAPLVKACGDLAAQLRKDSAEAYVRMADEVEGFLAEELAAMTPDDLGQIDTFREEENRVLSGAVDALRAGAWSKAKAWCEVRQGERSFWLQRDQLRRWAWSLVAEAAEFGETLARHPRPFEGARSLDEAVERYAASAFEVDRGHRRFEQRRLALLDSRLPHYGALREVATELRRAHRAWADQLAKDFAALCKEHGFLPSADLRQRSLFEQVVHPLTLASEKVAVFVIDAFRYEMATELVDELKGAGTVVDLKPRLAELPTITAVGMNVLAPVAQGDRLTVAGEFQGFKTGEFTVRKPEDRARAMGMRSAGKPALLLKLAKVCEDSTVDLTKSVKAHQLIVVHSQEIDDAGEANVGLPTFESTLRQIKAAWHHLQLAGVRSCVFTADHGFLLQDETTEVRPFGKKNDPQRRHVLDEHPRAEAGMVHVSVSSLGYEGLSGYLLFRDDTAVFATGNAGASFVHGGNSPQERVIPVLTVTRKRVEQGGYAEYAVEVEPQPDVVGLHRLRLRIGFAKQTTTSLGFATARAVDLALRVPDRPEVRVIIKDVAGPSSLKPGRLQVPVGEAWTEVFFGLEGPSDERVRVEIYHPDSIEKLQGATPDPWYSVSGTSRGTKPPTIPPPAPEGWAGTIADEGIRKVFLHIEKHGVITEPEVTTLLGSARAFRRFSLEFESHLPKLPFKVRIEPGEGGKRYVREGDR